MAAPSHPPTAAPLPEIALDPRKLLYFATIIDAGSLAKAAKQLSVSQPALSKSMTRLEDELGRTLLERGPSGVTATVFGELMYAHARLIRDEMGLARSQVGSEATVTSSITVGTLPSLSSSVVPLAVGRWRERHPDVLLRVVEKVQVDLLLGLLRGEFDFVLGQTEFYDDLFDGLKQRVLFRDRLCVFAREDHRLFAGGAPAWPDLVEFPWVCATVGWPQSNILEKILAAENLPAPRQLVECGSIDFTKSLVASSDHLALLPIHSVVSSGAGSGIRPLEITVPALKRDIAVIFRGRAALSELSQDFISIIESIGTELSRPEP